MRSPIPFAAALTLALAFGVALASGGGFDSGLVAPASGETTITVPAPLYGQTLIAEPAGGSTLFRAVGTDTFLPLEGPQVLALDSSFDATAGGVRLTPAKSRKGGVQTAEVFGGRFRVRQAFKGKPLTDLMLEGFRSGACRGGQGGQPAPPAPNPNRLWASATGGFHSTGKHGGAIVAGIATWLTEDRCNGTFFRVKSGAVTIQDFTRGKNLRLAAGHHYLARKRSSREGR